MNTARRLLNNTRRLLLLNLYHSTCRQSSAQCANWAAPSRHYSAQCESWAAPSRHYSAQCENWAAPSRHYSAQCENWAAPSRHYSAQCENWAAPSRHYSAQCENWVAPSRHYSAQCENWAAPSRHYSAQCENWAAPSRHYSAQCENRAAPSRHYSAQCENWAAPSRQYSAQCENWAAPSRQYSAQCENWAAPSRHYSAQCENWAAPSRQSSSYTKQERLLDNDADEAVLYVHWPYCARRCTYCNFNKYISKSVEHTRMAECLAVESRTLLQLSGVSRINSIFFGGGTPSLALPSTISRVIDTVRDHVTFTTESEVTLEANPTHMETGILKDFQRAGVNRLSIGVQALNTGDLKLLGRDHSVIEALRCVEEAKFIFPERVSVDLMFGRPGQTLEAWTDELRQVLDMAVNHVSLYQLTVERGTQLFKWVDGGQITVPDNDAMADMYIAAVEMFQAHGLDRYEVSNFARKGSESEHNQAYWQAAQYIGVGPGAHGRFTTVNWSETDNNVAREARIQTLEPDNWMYEVQKYGHATRKVVPLSIRDRLEELLILGLRTREGVTSDKWLSLSDRRSMYLVFSSSEKCSQFIEDGLLQLDESGMRATCSGMLILDTMLPHLLCTLGEACDSDGIY